MEQGISEQPASPLGANITATGLICFSFSVTHVEEWVMKKQTAKPFEKITAFARGGAFKAGRVEMPLGISASSRLLLI